MQAIDEIVKHSLQTGAVTAATTTLATAAIGQAEIGNPLAPLNAVSHIAWGDRAARQDGASAKYTLMGVGLNAAAVTGWAAVNEALFGRFLDRGNIAGALAGGAATSAMAFAVDYYVVPKRLTPGFEKRLSNASLFGIYTVLALSLAFGRAGFRGR